jgi:hypothetical protein
MWLTDNPMLVPQKTPANHIRTFDARRWPEILSKPRLPTDLSLPGDESNVMLMDPQDAASYSSLPQMALPKGNFVVLTSLATGVELDCGYSWVGKKIGYIDRTSLLFVLSVLHGHRIALDSVRLVYIPHKFWNRMDAILGITLDLIVAFFIPGTPSHLMLMRQNINIMGFQRIQLERLRMTSPHITLEQAELVPLFEGGRVRVLARERTTRLPTLELKAVRFPLPAMRETFVPAMRETFLVAEDNSREQPYRCFGDEKLFTKAACDSPYDVSGLPKPIRTVWDRKCVSNDDCPFYTGKRGGCDTNTGECEMPIGPSRMSYRTFNTRPPFQPFCYSGDPWALSGCNGQWAFPNDGGYISLRTTANKLLLEQKPASDGE